MSDKPRMVEVTGEELTAIHDAGLGGPFLYRENETKYYVEADELRAWRASHDTSSEKP